MQWPPLAVSEVNRARKASKAKTGGALLAFLASLALLAKVICRFFRGAKGTTR